LLRSRTRETTLGRSQAPDEINLWIICDEAVRLALCQVRFLCFATAHKHISLSEFVVNVYNPSISVDQNRLGTAAASVPGGNAAAHFAGLPVPISENSSVDFMMSWTGQPC
jgi:hypothetical protein